MTDSDADRLEGAACTATLDPEAQTLTFEHRGWLRSKAQKLSPVVVPLGEIASVEYKWGRISGWFRIVRRDQNPWTDVLANDPHALNCGVDPTPFAKRVQAAAGLEEPLTADEDEDGQLAPDAAEAKAEPRLGVEITKTVGRVIDLLARYPFS